MKCIKSMLYGLGGVFGRKSDPLPTPPSPPWLGRGPLFSRFSDFRCIFTLNVHIDTNIHVYNEFYVVGPVLRCVYIENASLKLCSHYILAFLLRFCCFLLVFCKVSWLLSGANIRIVVSSGFWRQVWLKFGRHTCAQRCVGGARLRKWAKLPLFGGFNCCVAFGGAPCPPERRYCYCSG